MGFTKPRQNLPSLQDIFSDTITDKDKKFIQIAQELKNQISLPKHSNFRTFTVITYFDTKGQIQYVTGTNNETFFLGGTICGERSACVKLPESDVKSIDTVYIISDADQYISMGVACRDFLSDHMSSDTRVVMWSESNYKICRLSDLYPHPAIFRDIDTKLVLDHAKNFSETMEKSVFDESLQALYNQVVSLTERDSKPFHPIKLAAGVLYSDGSTNYAWQDKMLEFALTVDPVTLLINQIRLNYLKGVHPVAIIQCDQFGILQTLSPSARVNMGETGFKDVLVYLHDEKGKIQKCTVADLYPDIPKVDEML